MSNSKFKKYDISLAIFYILQATFDAKNCDQVRLIICDGDKNECSQIDYTIRSSLFPNAIRSRCIWHIVDCGWIKHKLSHQLASKDPSVLDYNENIYASKLKDAGDFVKSWCYSFGKSYYKTKKEFNISSKLLRKYVQTLNKTLGEHITFYISKFLKENVFPYETEIFLQKNENTNLQSVHEHNT